MARVLLVDDSFIVRELISATLASAGHEVTAVEDGPSALASVEASPPDVVVCDMQMPGMSGFEVIRALKAKHALLPTLILTEQSDVSVCVNALREGAVGYVLKGMGEELLLREVDAALAERSLKEKNRQLEEANQAYHRHLEEMVAEKTAEVLRLQQLKSQAERMASLGTLVAGVAHEVNNPLAVVKSNLAWLKEFSGMMQQMSESLDQSLRSASRPRDDELNEDIRALPQVVSEASQGVDRIMRIVKALRRISSPSLPGGACRVVDALHDAALAAKLASVPQISLERDLESSDLEVALSREDLCTLLTHLITNGMHALPPLGGALRIHAERLPQGDVRICVSDNGCGIPAEQVDRVCEPFFTTKDPGKGVGLGLTLVRQLVTGHGGAFTLHSRVGQGTEVVLELPPPALTVAAPVSQGRLRV